MYARVFLMSKKKQNNLIIHWSECIFWSIVKNTLI